ncbi:hypothetical protein FRB99_008791, partial [Tulasnella sp. 403]
MAREKRSHSTLADEEPDTPDLEDSLSLPSTSGRLVQAISEFAYTSRTTRSSSKRLKTKKDVEEVQVVKQEELDTSLPVRTKRAKPAASRDASPRKPKPVQMELDVPHAAPAHWEETYGLIKEMRERIEAPVDTMGCACAMKGEEDERSRRFGTLVALMLSSQTKDEVTTDAVKKLRAALGLMTVENVLAAEESVIQEAIAKVGFWRRKTGYIKQTAQMLKDRFNSDVPKTVDELTSLPGVGPKMAFLTLQVAWNLNLGIGVDVHVHRITNRLGWHKPPTITPEQTRLNLQSWLPKELHGEINPLLVGFGQVICLPIGPKCGSCTLSERGLCPSARKDTARSKRSPTKPKLKRSVTELMKSEGLETMDDTDNVKLEDPDLPLSGGRGGVVKEESPDEKERAENIKRNAELLAFLDVQNVHDELGIPIAKGKGKGRAPSGSAKPVQPRPKRKREDVPLRRSSRFKTEPVDPNETPAQKRKREFEEKKRREEAERQREAELEKAREAQKPRHHDLELGALLDDPSPESNTSLWSNFGALCSTKHSRPTGSSGNARDETLRSDARLEEVKKAARKATVRARAKVNNDRVYSMAYHPDTTKDIIFFGDKHGQIGIWDPLAPPDDAEDDEDAETREGGQYWRLQMHWPASSKSSVSCIKFDPIDAHSVITSSYDCTIRQTSFLSGISTELFYLEDELISSFDLPPTGNEVWISDTSGGLSHIDMRESIKACRRWDVNGTGHKIGCVSINPVSTYFLVTASNDRHLRLWDARKLTPLPITSTPMDEPSSRKVKKEDNHNVTPAETAYEEVKAVLDSKRGKGLLRGSYAHNQSVSSAYWDPSGRRIVSTSYDDHLRVWDVKPANLVFDAPLPIFNPFVRRYHNCQTGKWLTILRAQWMPSPDVYPHFVIGSLDHSLDVIGYDGEQIASLSNKS